MPAKASCGTRRLRCPPVGFRGCIHEPIWKLLERWRSMYKQRCATMHKSHRTFRIKHQITRRSISAWTKKKCRQFNIALLVTYEWGCHVKLHTYLKSVWFIHFQVCQIVIGVREDGVSDIYVYLFWRLAVRCHFNHRETQSSPSKPIAAILVQYPF